MKGVKSSWALSSTQLVSLGYLVSWDRMVEPGKCNVGRFFLFRSVIIYTENHASFGKSVSNCVVVGFFFQEWIWYGGVQAQLEHHSDVQPAEWHGGLQKQDSPFKGDSLIPPFPTAGCDARHEGLGSKMFLLVCINTLIRYTSSNRNKPVKQKLSY